MGGVLGGLSRLDVCGFRRVGCVEGGEFRLATRDKDRSLGVCGWGRNLADGSVEVRVQGPSPSVDQLIAWLWQGPPAAKVYKVRETEPADDHPSGRESFVIR